MEIFKHRTPWVGEGENYNVLMFDAELLKLCLQLMHWLKRFVEVAVCMRHDLPQIAARHSIDVFQEHLLNTTISV